MTPMTAWTLMVLMFAANAVLATRPRMGPGSVDDSPLLQALVVATSGAWAALAALLLAGASSRWSWGASSWSVATVAAVVFVCSMALLAGPRRRAVA